MGFRPKKPIQRRTDAGLSPAQLEIHLDGEPSLDQPQPVFRDEEELKQSWEKSKHAIMALQGHPVRGESYGLSPPRQTYFDWGSRPESWWKFSAPEPRRLLRGNPNNAFPEQGMRKGIPTRFRSREAYMSMEYESEKAYLIRHNLLNTAEKAIFDREVEDKSAVEDSQDTTHETINERKEP